MPDRATHELALQLDGWRDARYPTRHRTRAAAAWNAASAAAKLEPVLVPPGQQARVGAAWRALREEGGTLLLVGTRGVGKTQLATSLGLALAANGLLGTRGRSPSQSYHVLGELFRAEKRTFAREPGASSAASPLDLAAKADLLVLDEVHVRHESAWEDIELTLLFDRRYQDMRRTILIANLTPDQAREKLGSSVWSRIVETGVVLECDWPSFRKGAGA